LWRPRGYPQNNKTETSIAFQQRVIDT